MSKHEVVQEFLQGRIDRREFVRRLTLAGVAAAAAVTFAETLSSPVAASSLRGGGAYVSRSQVVYDADGDGLSDDEEDDLGTDPNDPDTDGDGVDDGDEVDCGSDPLDPNSKCTSTKPPSELPSTGVAGGESGSKWMGPLAAAGAGIAIIARGFQKVSRNTPR